MNISSIGVQQILPQTGIIGQGSAPAPEQDNSDGDNPAMVAPDRAPAAPGTGEIVDKTV
jgi:hypothetical protein